MQPRPICAQNMATPYMLWPYMPISPLTSSPEVPIFHGQFPHNATLQNDLHSPFLSPQLYANNIILQTYHQQQHPQQQQLTVKLNDNAFIQNINNNRLDQQDQFMTKIKTDINCNLSNGIPCSLDSPPRRRRPSTPTRIRSSPTSAKKGLFTIDAILNKSDQEEKLQEESKLPTSHSSSPLFLKRRQRPGVVESATTTTDNWLSSVSDLPSPGILDETPMTCGENYLPVPAISVFHSTPVNYHHRHHPSGSPRRHSGAYIDTTHQFFPKNLNVYQSHIYSYQQHHQNLLAQVSPQSSMSRSTLGSSSMHSSLSMSTSSSSPASSSSSSSTSLSSPKNDQTDRKASNKNKRIRTIFTPDQLERLETEFERQQYMVGTERFYLASSLHLTEAQVKVWFQNRRIKWRKQHLEQQQARLAQGDLYRDVEEEESGDSELEDDVTDAVQNEAFTKESSTRSDID